MTTDRKHLTKVAKLEIAEWDHSRMPPAIVLCILFCFIHRVTTGETVEETFFRNGEPATLDYEI